MSKRKIHRNNIHQQITNNETKPPSQLGPQETGLVVARFGHNAAIEDANGKVINCFLRKNIGALVTGDKVLWQPQYTGGGVVTAILKRTSVFCRPNKNGQLQPMAANVSQMLIITAPQPAASTQLIDRYLVAAQLQGINASLIINKCDLLNTKTKNEQTLRQRLYQNLGYQCIFSQTKQAGGLSELINILDGNVSIIIGQSGVGKSSIINKLLPDMPATIGSLSNIGEGMHTTTTARLYHFAPTASIIDSPGIRNFSLANIEPSALAAGFVEFEKYLGKCKFSDCMHLTEPGCAINKAVAEQKISAERLQSYRGILRSL